MSNKAPIKEGPLNTVLDVTVLGIGGVVERKCGRGVQHCIVNCESIQSPDVVVGFLVDVDYCTHFCKDGSIYCVGFKRISTKSKLPCYTHEGTTFHIWLKSSDPSKVFIYGTHQLVEKVIKDWVNK